MMNRVYQQNINKPTEELTAEVLQSLMEQPRNQELIDAYRQLNLSLIPDNYFQQFLGVFVGLTICFSATASWKIEL